MSLQDNAGINVVLHDESQVATSPLQTDVTVASIIVSERGLMNRPQLISNDTLKVKRFGSDNSSKYGASSLDCKNVLDSGMQMYIIRPGETSWRLAGSKFSKTGSSLPVPTALQQADMDMQATFAATEYFRLAAMGEGVWGNNIVLRFAALEEGETFEDADNSRVKRLEVYYFEKGVSFATAPSYDVWSLKFKSTTPAYVGALSLIISGVEYIVTMAADDTLTDYATALNALPAFTALFTAAAVDTSLTVTSKTFVRYTNVKFVDSNFVSIAASTQVSVASTVDADNSQWAFDNANYLVDSSYVSLNSKDLDSKGKTLFISEVLKSSYYLYGLCNNALLDSLEDADWEVAFAQMNFGDSDWTAATPTHPNVFALAGGTLATDGLSSGFASKISQASSAKEALTIIANRNYEYRCFVTLNANNEIAESDFAEVVANFDQTSLCISSLGRAYASYDADTLISELTDSTITFSRDRFLAMYWQWLSVSEKSTNKYVFISPASFVAKVIGDNTANGNYPRPPAGYNYGKITGYNEISSTINGIQRKKLVKFKINPIKSDSKGTVFWDQLDTQAGKSALSDLHVILSFLAIKFGIIDTYTGFEFEFNDDDTIKTMTRLLTALSNTLIANKYAEEISVDSSQNVLGSDEIILALHVRFKGVARIITVNIVAHPSNQSLAVSLAS